MNSTHKMPDEVYMCHYCQEPSVDSVQVPQAGAAPITVRFCEPHFQLFAKRARNFAAMNDWMLNLSARPKN